MKPRDPARRRRGERAPPGSYCALGKRVCTRTADLEVANRTLQMIGSCNEALVRATDESELVDDICRIVYGLGQYRMVWVGLAERDRQKSVRPVAARGFEQGYLERAHITWSDRARGRGPTGACIRAGKAQVCRDFLTDPKLAPWREDAAARGYRSSIALPLMASGRVFGALTIYSASAGAFDGERTRRLQEMANNLAFGIQTRRARVERDLARRIAEERAVQLRALTVLLGEAEQRERSRLAKVLHDHLQQLLVGARFNLGSLRGKLRSEEKKRVVGQVAAVLDGAIDVARSLTVVASPPVLETQGLGPALEGLGRQLGERLGLEVEVSVGADAEPHARQLRLLLFEAVREMLLNVAKHSGVKRAQVRLSRHGREQLKVSVSDRGCGFEPKGLAVDGWNGFGLVSIRERLRYFGGHLEIDAAPGRGSRFTLVGPRHWPGPEAARRD